MKTNTSSGLSILINLFLNLVVERFPKKHAVEKPSLENIAKAAKSLGLHPVLEKNCAYPSKHWKKEGRLLVDKKGPKSKMLVQIANRL